jgi:nicotinamidase-related amidase
MSNTALLVMDVQPSILGRLEKPEEYLAKVRVAVDGAHKHQIPVIFVVVGFRPGLPEISGKNKAFSSIPASATAQMIDPKPVILPIEGDLVVTKRRVSAFTGSDLEVVLRAKGIDHLVLCGISTSGVVLSTTREAADKDYHLTILSDLCFDFDPEVHAVLLEKLFPRQATVQTSEKWMGEM